MTSLFSAEGGPIWIKFRRLVQNDMTTVVIWSKSKPDVEFQYGGRLGEFHGMSFQSHLPHCGVLPFGEFTVMIPEPHATLQGAVTWRIQCHDRATLQGVIIPSAIFKIVFRHILFYFILKCSLGFDERRLLYRLRYTCLAVEYIKFVIIVIFDLQNEILTLHVDLMRSQVLDLGLSLDTLSPWPCGICPWPWLWVRSPC